MGEVDSREERRVTEEALKEEVWDLAYLMRALGDPTRLSIVRLLQERQEICVCELQGILGCTRSALWHHIRVLKEAGLVHDRREWKHVRCSLLPGEPQAFMRRFRTLLGFPSPDTDAGAAAGEDPIT